MYISSPSEHLVRVWGKSRDTNDVSTRLYKDSSERERRLKDLKIEYIESEIHVPNGKEAHFNPDRFNELYREGVEKLAAAREQDKDPYRQHSLVAARELDELENDCTFQPNAEKYGIRPVGASPDHHHDDYGDHNADSMNIRIRYYHTGDE